MTEKKMTEKKMTEYEEKFIVINRKRFEELNEYARTFGEHPAVENLKEAIRRFREAYECDCGKPMDQKYYVVNQDELYADNIIKLIIDNESVKDKT